MDPVAIRLTQNFEIRWYGIFAALAFMAGYSLLKMRARRRDFSDETVDQLAFWVLVGGILGARILYVFTHLSEFRGRWIEALAIWQGGLVFYGGFIGAFIAAFAVATLRKMPRRSLADLVAPSLPLGHALGRIGCFLNGCCFGKPYEGPGAVQYSLPAYEHVGIVQQYAGHLAAGFDECLPVFPVQLLAVVYNLLIFSVLLLIEPRLPRKGQLLALYVTLYSVVRFLTEFLRGDYLHKTAGLTQAQIICLILLPAGIAAFAALGRMPPEKEQVHGS